MSRHLQTGALRRCFYFCFVAITLCSRVTVGVFSYIHQQRTDAALADMLGRKLAMYYGVPDRN